MAHQSANSISAHVAGLSQEQKSAFDPLKVALALLSRLPSGKNSVISPHSIASVLAMLYFGAKGHTRSELERVLHMSKDACDRFVDATGKLQGYQKDEGTRLRSSNGAYVTNDLKIESDYSQCLERLAAKVTLVDFAEQPEPARQQINAWIAEETGGLIKDLLPAGAIDSTTALVLANAIYFKGLWKESFEAERTFDGEFTVASGKVVTAKMMTLSSSFPYALDEQHRLQLLLLPYAGNGDLGMLLLLPLEDASLDACFTQNFSSVALASAVEQMSSVKVDVVLPRFSVSSFVDVKEGLGALGVESLFSSVADLSGMCRDRPLCVSSCVHRALVDVTEEGTEAAAATAAMVVSYCMVWSEKFVCNRPFAFAIWHKPTAAALFFGRVEDPTLAGDK